MFPPMTPPPFGWNGPNDNPCDGGRGPRGPRGRRGRGPRGPWDGPRPGRDFYDGVREEIREYARQVKEEAREYQRLLEEEAREYERMMEEAAHEHQRVMDEADPDIVDEEAQERRRRLHKEAKERQRALREEAQERRRRLQDMDREHWDRMRDHYHDRPGRPGRPGRGFRDAEHTRRNVLDAAIRSLITEGLGVSIQAIATAAGITKSGLMHHFNNRTELLVSVAEEAMADFRNQVIDNIDLAENRPGKLLRAYVRTLFDNLEYQDSYDPAQLWNVLAPMSEITELLIDDAAQWRVDLAGDGLDADRVTIVMHAANSFVHEAQLDPGISAEDIARTKRIILALTDETGPLVTIADGPVDDVKAVEAEIPDAELADDDTDTTDTTDNKDSDSNSG